MASKLFSFFNEVDYVVNRTNEVIVCYNNEGEFIKLLPVGNIPLPNYQVCNAYIVTAREYNSVKATGRITDDLVHVVDRHGTKKMGRGGIEVVYLQSYDCPKSFPSKRFVSPGSRSLYEENDPDEKIHVFLKG